jgi:hypothetical protein
MEDSMIDPNLIEFVWEAITAGVIGSAAYEGVRAILGKGYDKLASYSKNKQKSNFDATLLSILEEDERVKQQLSQLQKNLISYQKQTHSGVGDNVGRDKIINYTNPSPLQISRYNLTDKQKDTLRALVKIGQTWQEEFTITWFPDGTSDILDYLDTPPEIPEGHIRVLEEEGLLNCEFFIDGNAEITLTNKSYKAVETNFQETI